jgi:hypothetical protein
MCYGRKSVCYLPIIYSNSLEHLKASLEDDAEPPEELRLTLHSKMKEYKEKVARLKEYKLEIEHVQHLMDQAKTRVQRDFENYLEATQTLSRTSLRDDIKAFYAARDALQT